MKYLVCVALLYASAISAKVPTSLFYLMETPKSMRSFVEHIEKIDLLVPTWYGVDAQGLVQGAPNPYVLQLASRKKLPVMPIISMTAGREGFHKLLLDLPAQQRAIEALLLQARLHGFLGYQFDFENLAWTDRDAFTAFARRTAEAMHQAHRQLSIAVVPNAPGFAGRGAFSKWMWEYWRGAYDLEALAEVMDFVSLMTYDQHTRWTTPGPVAGWGWTLEHLDYALQFIPKDKLSIGIALYGYHWFAGNPVFGTEERSNISADYIDADESIPLAREYGAKIQWDADEHEAFYWFYRDQLREWVSMPDAHAFRDRYELAKKRGLLGFSAWVLGAEDPAVWDVLPEAVRRQ
jgi:spore germination protein YaaH